MSEKYYTAFQHAENMSDGVVRLTAQEHQAVKKFLNQVYSFSAGYCGTCGIGDVGHDTEAEAYASNDL